MLKLHRMKKLFSIFALVIMFSSLSCKKDKTPAATTDIEGAQSTMGTVGTLVHGSTLTAVGVTGLVASVVSLSNGVSSYSGSCAVTNPVIKNILSNIPGITITGDSVKATGFEFKSTVEGVQSYVGLAPGILVKYASEVGDTYPVGSTGRVRTVISKSTTDDYFWDYMLIKVMEIEEPTSGLKSLGVNKITYVANHKFGLVGIQFNFTDGTSAKFQVYTSSTN